MLILDDTSNVFYLSAEKWVAQVLLWIILEAILCKLSISIAQECLECSVNFLSQYLFHEANFGIIQQSFLVLDVLMTLLNLFTDVVEEKGFAIDILLRGVVEKIIEFIVAFKWQHWDVVSSVSFLDFTIELTNVNLTKNVFWTYLSCLNDSSIYLT